MMIDDGLRIGMIMRVIRGDPERHNAKWFEKGDLVEVVGVYDHIILCKRIKKGKGGWRMKQCFHKNSWWKDLEVVSG